MEDQQPAAGDLAADELAPEGAAADEGADSPDTDEGASAAAESTSDESEADAAGAQPAGRKKRKWLAGKRLAITVVVAAMLFVGSAAFAGATVQPYLADRAAAATKLKVARTAADAITTLWTYTPENMDTLADRASRYLSGDFEAQYRKFVDAIVAPNKQAKITNHTDVTGAAVESIDDTNAVVIVYTNTTSTSPLTKNVPSLKYLSYRLFLKRAKGRWLVTRMTTITSLDLTPHV
ncbi:Mce protein [Mycobacterium paraseoulense]|uniref:Mce protein n=1 Tax=Mycobacterium paraseoulense TaxID=590652 RepID=A0A1X0I3P0_9MYCO|nr:Mce protein [Mycobacterium paraseoulense]MCV7396434.1 Mce protein [Mycobacterium paraseoulense]ORB33664.1 Mce protein [Mycobacterium paraseoulense]BBZ72985.1 Mce associated membrane protein [Mycobacterium paraseoulense]